MSWLEQLLKNTQQAAKHPATLLTAGIIALSSCSDAPPTSENNNQEPGELTTYAQAPQTLNVNEKGEWSAGCEAEDNIQEINLTYDGQTTTKEINQTSWDSTWTDSHEETKELYTTIQCIDENQQESISEEKTLIEPGSINSELHTPDQLLINQEGEWSASCAADADLGEVVLEYADKTITPSFNGASWDSTWTDSHEEKGEIYTKLVCTDINDQTTQKEQPTSILESEINANLQAPNPLRTREEGEWSASCAADADLDAVVLEYADKTITPSFSGASWDSTWTASYAQEKEIQTTITCTDKTQETTSDQTTTQIQPYETNIQETIPELTQYQEATIQLEVSDQDTLKELLLTEITPAGDTKKHEITPQTTTWDTTLTRTYDQPGNLVLELDIQTNNEHKPTKKYTHTTSLQKNP